MQAGINVALQLVVRIVVPHKGNDRNAEMKRFAFNSPDRWRAGSNYLSRNGMDFIVEPTSQLNAFNQCR